MLSDEDGYECQAVITNELTVCAQLQPNACGARPFFSGCDPLSNLRRSSSGSLAVPQIHWAVADSKLSMLAIFTNAPGWVGISFPAVSGQMSPADAVIARSSSAQTYRLSGRSVRPSARWMLLEHVLAHAGRHNFSPSLSHACFAAPACSPRSIRARRCCLQMSLAQAALSA